jgi:hypothetical protein
MSALPPLYPIYAAAPHYPHPVPLPGGHGKGMWGNGGGVEVPTGTSPFPPVTPEG